MSMPFDRRRFLGLAAAGALSAPLWPRRALGQAIDKPTVVLIFLRGGYNCVFSSADACVPGNLFGATEGNVLELGGGLVVDKATLGSLPPEVRDHMCTVGAHHGFADHINGVRIWWNDPRGGSYPLRMARALGGDAALRCVSFGAVPGVHKPLDGVALSVVPDLSGALLAAGASSPPGAPDRSLLAKSLDASATYSARAFSKSPNQLGEYHTSLHTVRHMLSGPPRSIDWGEISTAYGLGADSGAINTFTEQLAGAEVMVRSGADVVLVQDGGRGVTEGADWDSHGDASGEQVRAIMADRIQSLGVFLRRTLSMPGHNVVTALYAEFARTASSDHAGGLSATVFGKGLKNGSTGQARYERNSYRLPVGTPGVDGFFAMVADAAGARGSAFGENPHRALFR